MIFKTVSSTVNFEDLTLIWLLESCNEAWDACGKCQWSCLCSWMYEKFGYFEVAASSSSCNSMLKPTFLHEFKDQDVGMLLRPCVQAGWSWTWYKPWSEDFQVALSKNDWYENCVDVNDDAGSAKWSPLKAWEIHMLCSLDLCVQMKLWLQVEVAASFWNPYSLNLIIVLWCPCNGCPLVWFWFHLDLCTCMHQQVCFSWDETKISYLHTVCMTMVLHIHKECYWMLGLTSHGWWPLWLTGWLGGV